MSLYTAEISIPGHGWRRYDVRAATKEAAMGAMADQARMDTGVHHGIVIHGLCKVLAIYGDGEVA